jgi:hypothetical protein
MAKTYIALLKKDAKIEFVFNTEDIAKLQTILLKHLTKENVLDDESWNIIQDLCNRIDECAQKQNQIESKEVNF